MKELGSESWQYLMKELKEEQAQKMLRACLPHLRCSKIAGVAGAGWEQMKLQEKRSEGKGNSSGRASQETGRTLATRMF